jgi:hypothetical protein
MTSVVCAERRLVAAAAAGPAERPAAVGGIDREVVGQVAQPRLQRAQRLEREVDRQVRAEEVGPGDGAEHHRAAAEQRPRPAGLAEEVALVVGGVARGVEGAEGQVAEHELVAGRQLVDVRARLGRQLALAGYVVVVQVGVQRRRELQPLVAGERQVALDVAHRVDDHRLVAAGDDKARVPQLGRADDVDRVHGARRTVAPWSAGRRW